MGMRKEIWKGAADIFYMIHLRPSMLSNAKCSYIEHENTPRACILKCTSGKTVFFLLKVDKQTHVAMACFFFLKDPMFRNDFCFPSMASIPTRPERLFLCCWEVQFQLPLTVGRCRKETAKRLTERFLD